MEIISSPSMGRGDPTLLDDAASADSCTSVQGHRQAHRLIWRRVSTEEINLQLELGSWRSVDGKLSAANARDAQVMCWNWKRAWSLIVCRLTRVMNGIGPLTRVGGLLRYDAWAWGGGGGGRRCHTVPRSPIVINHERQWAPVSSSGVNWAAYMPCHVRQLKQKSEQHSNIKCCFLKHVSITAFKKVQACTFEII